MMNNLKKALRDVYEAELNAEISQAGNEEMHSFSAEYNQRIEKIIKKHNKTERQMYTQRRVRVACAFLALMIVCVSVMNVEAISETVRGFVIEIMGGEKKISYDGDEPEQEIGYSIKEYFSLSWVPDGFKLNYSYKTGTSVTYIYSKGNSTIYFAQYLKSNYDDADMGDNNYNLGYTEDGKEYLIIECPDSVGYIWEKDEYVFNLNVPCDFTEEEVEKICMKIKSEKVE